MNRSVALHSLGRHDEALDETSTVIDLVPNHTGLLLSAHNRRMKIYAEMGVLLVPELVVEATAVIELNPSDTDTLMTAHMGRAFGLAELGRYSDAADDLRVVTSLLPEGHPDGIAAADLLQDMELAMLSQDGG